LAIETPWFPGSLVPDWTTAGTCRPQSTSDQFGAGVKPSEPVLRRSCEGLTFLTSRPGSLHPLAVPLGEDPGEKNDGRGPEEAAEEEPAHPVVERHREGERGIRRQHVHSHGTRPSVRPADLPDADNKRAQSATDNSFDLVVWRAEPSVSSSPSGGDRRRGRYPVEDNVYDSVRRRY